MNMVVRFVGWVRRLLSLRPTPAPGQAAHPGPSNRSLHLMVNGAMRSACNNAAASPTNWVTVQLQHVTCKKCKAIGNRRAVVRNARVR